MNAPVAEERAQPELDPRAVAQRVVAFAARREFGCHVVLVAVRLDEPVHVGVGRRVDAGDQVADTVRVDAEPEPPLGLELVALGDRDLPHVVAEARDATAQPVLPGARGPCPDPDPVLDGCIGPVPDHDRAFEAKPCGEEPELAVTMGGLVQVHEVHVDGGPRDLVVELRVQVEERLLEATQAGDPHLGRRERVHPGDEPDACVARIRLLAQPPDLVREGQDGLDHHLDRDPGSSVERSRDRRGMLGDGRERLRTVEVLRSGDEPDFVGADVRHLAESSTTDRIAWCIARGAAPRRRPGACRAGRAGVPPRRSRPRPRSSPPP